MACRYNSSIGKYFTYNPDVPGCLVWSVTMSRNVETGDVAGHFSDYYRVKIYGVTHMNHKIVWALHNEFTSQENLQIDHIDGDTANNKIDNLRLVTTQVNLKNTRRKSNNSSGFTGVDRRVDKYKDVEYVRYRAIWVDSDGIRRSKSFRVIHSEEEALHLAVNHRRKMIEIQEGYTDRHGF